MYITHKMTWTARVKKDNKIHLVELKVGDNVKIEVPETTLIGQITKLTVDEMYIRTFKFPQLIAHKDKIVSIHKYNKD